MRIRTVKPMFVVVAVALGALDCLAQATPEGPPKARLEFWLTEKEERGDVYSQSRRAGVDYRTLLRGAVAKQERSLRALFRHTAYGSVTGAGAEMNCEILWRLLRFWGDAEFARVLNKESPRVREAVIWSIDYELGLWSPTEFPKTYRLAAHQSEDTLYPEP